MHPKLIVQTVISRPYEENTFVVHKPDAEKCLIIDPGFEPVKVFRCLEEGHLEPDAILNTHGHSDHIAGNGEMKSRWPACPLIVGRGDADKLTDPRKNLSADHGLALISPDADRLVGEGDTIDSAGLELHVLETPGHSAGHVVFVWKEASPFVVFGGDVLFAGSVGRSDFLDGDFQKLVGSVHEKLFPLPDDTIVYPGHGPATTIGHEKQTNPFVAYRPAIVSRDPDNRGFLQSAEKRLSRCERIMPRELCLSFSILVDYRFVTDPAGSQQKTSSDP